MYRQLARLWAPRLLPRELVSRRNPIATTPPLRLITADRRCCESASSLLLGPIGPPQCPRYLFALRHRQRQTGSAPGRRHDPAAGPHIRKNAGRQLATGPPDRLQAFTLLRGSSWPTNGCLNGLGTLRAAGGRRQRKMAQGCRPRGPGAGWGRPSSAEVDAIGAPLHTGDHRLTTEP
jgi:hypothetical protein